jgi:hypothetical protein
MQNTRTSTRLRATTVGGLVTGAVGISILWAAGQEFPVYPPPGIIILAVGAVFVGLTSRPWTPLVGAVIAAFVAVGFVVSGLGGGDGFDNVSGVHGAGRSIGQVVQLIGVIIALVASTLHAKANYSRP